MVVYDLICDANHRFEGWFKSPEDLSHQQDVGLLSCPVCTSHEVKKLPTASRLSTQKSRGELGPVSAERATHRMASTKINANLAKQVREFIENNSEDVGTRFAEEAKKMHYGETAERNIRGQATGEELRELRDNGINAVPLPDSLIGKGKLN